MITPVLGQGGAAHRRLLRLSSKASGGRRAAARGDRRSASCQACHRPALDRGRWRRAAGGNGERHCGAARRLLGISRRGKIRQPCKIKYSCDTPESVLVREWCSRRTSALPSRGALHRAAGSRRRASGIVRDDGRLAMSISAHAARSTSAVGCRKSGWLTTAFCRLSGGRVHVV